jgi:DNA-directed RNA polymerase subunit RPC12/RpoP
LDADAGLLARFVTYAELRGVDASLAPRHLVRALLDRGDAAQVRRNPIHRDEPFACTSCGRDVAIGGVPVRDHCPFCLRGLHVDVVPGDRAAGCGGVLEPLGLEHRPEIVILYACTRCAHRFAVRAHPDDDLRRLALAVGGPPAPGGGTR